MKWAGPHLVLLPLQPLHVVEFLRLQLAHPIVQLVDLVPAGDTQTHRQHTPVKRSRRCGHHPPTLHVLQLVLVQVVDVELLASGGQNLLLLLSLRLLLASSLLVGLEGSSRAG